MLNNQAKKITCVGDEVNLIDTVLNWQFKTSFNIAHLAMGLYFYNNIILLWQLFVKWFFACFRNFNEYFLRILGKTVPSSHNINREEGLLFMENKYFLHQDKLSIDSFLLIPKMLYKYPKYKTLNSVSRLIYSLYLSRYTNTKYHDETGPYIIYSDKELMEKLGISRATCSRSKKELSEAGLIILKKTTGYNKIYIMNYRAPDKSEFYSESDLDSYSFYRFPSVFFEGVFDELSMNAKILYTYYFDWMCLSQMNYIVDDYDRIYFRENRQDQEANILMNKSVILEAKKQLIAADLLIEYQEFSKAKSFYLLKLANYNQKQLVKYNNLPKENRKQFLQDLSVQTKAVVTTPSVNLREIRKSLSLSVDFVVSYLTEKGHSISSHTYNRYERGSRKIPKEILTDVSDLFEKARKDHSCPNMKQANNAKRPVLSNNDTCMTANDTSRSPVMTHMETKNSTYSKPERCQTDIQICSIMESGKDTNISNTENNTKEIYTDDIYIDLNIEEGIQQKDKNINQSKSIDKIFYILNSNKYSVILSSLEELKKMKYFTVNKRRMSYQTLNDYMNIFMNYSDEQIKEYFENLIKRMKGQGYVFKTRRDVISCCLTFLFNDLVKGKEEIEKYITLYQEEWLDEWLRPDKEHYVSNFNWWEDEEK